MPTLTGSIWEIVPKETTDVTNISLTFTPSASGHSTKQATITADKYSVDLETTYPAIYNPTQNWYYTVQATSDQYTYEPFRLRVSSNTHRIGLRTPVESQRKVTEVSSTTPIVGLKDRLQIAGNQNWYQRSRYGLFSHYTYGGSSYPQTVQPNGVVAPSLNALADAFDAEKYAADAARWGFQYVTFTAWHYAMHALYPSAVLNQWIPGHTSTRDVLRDLINALKPYGIKIMFYVHLTDGHDLTASEQTATGWNDSTNNYATWGNFINDLLVELGQRYGRDLDGLWIDMTQSTEYTQKLYDKVRLRTSAKTGNPTRIIAGNNASDNTPPEAGGGVLDFASREYIVSRPADVKDWTGSNNQTVIWTSETGHWWAYRPVGSGDTMWLSANDMFRFTVLQAGTTTQGGGMAWNVSPYAGTNPSMWEDGVEDTMSAIKNMILPIQASLKDVVPSSSYVTPTTTTLNNLPTGGYVATTSADGSIEYIHVLNPPASSLTLSTPTDQVLFESAVNLATGRPVKMSLTNTGGYVLTLDSQDSWSTTDTVIALTRRTSAPESIFIDTGAWTGVSGAALSAQGGGSRFPVWTLDSTTNQQIQCSFMVPPHWGAFAIDLYWTQTAAGTGNVILTPTRSQVVATGSLTAGDEGLPAGTFACPGQNVLAVTRIGKRLRATPGAINHLRIARSASAGGDTGPTIGVNGISLTRLA